MIALRTLTIASRWSAIAVAVACSSAPDTPTSPVVSEPAFALRGTGCAPKTQVDLTVGAAQRLTDKEAACLNFKPIPGSRYLLAYVDTRLVNKALQQAEWPWPDSAVVSVTDISGGTLPTIAPTVVETQAHAPIAHHRLLAGTTPVLALPSNCPLLNIFYPHCRATPYTIGEAITHYPEGRPVDRARILTIVGNITIAVFEPDAAILVPNAKERADSALAWVVTRNIPLLQQTFSLANPTTTSDESGQLYVSLEATNLSSAAWWPDAATGHGRWARVTIVLGPNSAFGNISASYTLALQILGHETMHTYQYRWRYEHASPWQTFLGTQWGIEGGATFLAQEMIRDRLGIAFSGNTVFSASNVQDPTFPLGSYNFKVRNFTSGYSEAASLLRDLVQRLGDARMPLDEAMSLVLLGAMEGWYGINEENQHHGLGLARRMQQVLGRSWNPTDALLQWTMSEAADDLTTNPLYQNVTKRAFNPSTSTNSIRPDAVITPGKSASVSRGPGTTGVFEIGGDLGATYRASSNIIRNGVTPIEWLLLRIQ